MAESPRWPAVTLAALAGLNLLNYLDRYVLASVVTPIERELGLDDRHFAVAATAFMLGYFLTSPFFGWLGDRAPRRPLLAAGLVLWSAATLLSGRTGAFGSLVLFRVLVGIGEASFGTLGPAWIADLYPAARRGWAISIFYVAIPVGSALGFLLGGAVAAHWGWRAAFLVAGIPGLACAPLVLRLPEPARGASDPGGTARLGGGFRSLLRLREYRLVVAGYVAQTFALGGFGTWAAAFLERTHRLPLATADRFFGASLACAGLLATTAGGALGSSMERRRRGGYARLLALSAALAAPTALLALAVPGAGASMAALAAAMFLLFLPAGPVNTLILESVPPGLRARAMAVSIFAIHLLGDLWSPGIVGLVSDASGSLRTAAMLTLPPALALAAVFWGMLALRRPAAP